MADAAPIVDYVKRPSYPEMQSKPKVSRKPARPAQPASIATLGAKRQKGPVDAMAEARKSRLIGTIAGMAR